MKGVVNQRVEVNEEVTEFQGIYCYQNTHHCTVVPFASRHHMRICCFHHLLNKALVQFLDNSGGCSWVFQFRDVGNLH